MVAIAEAEIELLESAVHGKRQDILLLEEELEVEKEMRRAKKSHIICSEWDKRMFVSSDELVEPNKVSSPATFVLRPTL